ncbi:hypothetical protein [Vibrio owensii]|uniref:secretion/conjugation apparatus DotM-related subunit n=1 Tax=Vibrio harveyi group TaxID=717610 RepID=UPI003CC5AB12
MAQQQNSDNDIYILASVVVLFIGYYLLSKNYEYLVFVWKWIRIAELSPFYYLPDWFPFYGNLEIPKLFSFLYNTPYQDIHISTVGKIDKHLAGWLMWLPASWIIYRGFRRMANKESIDVVYNVDTLLVELSKLYPFLEHYVEVHPEKRDLDYNRDKPDTYRYGAALDPSEFALLSPPLGLEKEAKKNSKLKAPIWDGDEGFDMDLAERSFEAQMGNRFTGMKSLSSAEKKVYDFLVPKMVIGGPKCEEMFKTYIKSIIKVPNAQKIVKAKLLEGERTIYDLIEAEVRAKTELAKKKKAKVKRSEFLKEKYINGLIFDKKFKKAIQESAAQKTMSQHSFIRTGIMSLLEEARQSGVISCAEFNWLKGEDRVLWYALESVGRKVSFVESSGPFAHWLVELQLGQPLNHAEVQEAVTGLYKALRLDYVDE